MTTTAQPYSPQPVVLYAGRDSNLSRELLQSMTLDESSGGLASLELRFRNNRSLVGGAAGRAFDDDGLIKLGQALSAGMGDRDAPASMFSGYVSAIEESFEAGGAPQLCVLAEDALQKARLARRSQTHDALSIPSFANALAERLGLRAVVEGFTNPIGTHVQWNESDLAFLRRILAELDGELQVVERELHIRPTRDLNRGELELYAGRQLLRVTTTADLAHQVSHVTVSGWDARAGLRINVTSRPPELEASNGPSGAQWLARSFGTRREHLAHVPVRDEAEARALADSVHAQRAREFVRLSATAYGNPALRVGTRVRLRGVSPRFENTYVVTRTTHRYERGGEGYRTDFEAQCAQLKEGTA